MKKNDIVFIIVILLVGLFGLLGMKWYQSVNTGNLQVFIKHQGVIIKTYDFSPLTNETFAFVQGDETNTIRIQDGVVTMSEANCRDQICVKTRSIDKNGEIIVCLPHQLTVEIFAQSIEDALDGVVE